MKRRSFLHQSGQLALGYGLFSLAACTSTASSNEESEESAATTTTPETAKEMFFKISLAQWSLNKMIKAGELDALDFAKVAREKIGVDAIEYVSQLFADKAKDNKYLIDLKNRAADHGVKSLLIMIDHEGELGDTDAAKRAQAIENHYKWVDAAKFLGCHSVRVNAAGKGTAEEVAQAAVDGLGRLSEYAAKSKINVIVENHGSYSSDGAWLSKVISEVNLTNCGTLPDFGNFCITEEGDDCVDMYDRYKGVKELMPFAKAVSAKTHDFDEAGNEIHTDYAKMMKIVKDAGYTGYVGIEYEGKKLGEIEGILATKKLLEKVGGMI